MPTDSKQSHGKRLAAIREASVWLRDNFAVSTTIARERGFSRFAKETQALYKAHGVIEEVFSEFRVVDYAPTTVKKELTGSGKATKAQVAEAVQRYLAIPVVFGTDDESDAMAVALCHLIKTGEVKERS